MEECRNVPCMFWIIVYVHLRITVISQDNLEYTILEEMPIDSTIGNVLQDAALQTRHTQSTLRQLSFSLLVTSDVVSDFVIVEKNTGILKIKRKMDRDTMCPDEIKCSLQFSVTIKPLEYFQIINIHVFVIDINDNTPTFPKPNIHITVSEGTIPGVIAVLSKAEDPDYGENTIQEYRMQFRTSHFELNTAALKDGGALRLMLTKLLDREKQDSYKLKIVAYDGGMPRKSGSLVVDISVSDVNDNVPVFKNSSYRALILENITIHSSVLQVKATDSDKAENAEISYMLEKQSAKNYGNLFTIDSLTGVISVKDTLNSQKKSIFELTVQAINKGRHPVPATTKVTIVVLDVNDHAPQITVRSLTSTGNVEIAENASPGSFVAHISVVDGDRGENARVDCFLDGDNFLLQTLTTSGYKLVTSKSLDREVMSKIPVTVTCKDHGKPSLVEHMSVMVSVLDKNDNPPTFRHNTIFVRMKENCDRHRPVIQMTAHDADHGRNAVIEYSFRDPDIPFAKINPSTGYITCVPPVDHEELESIETVVIAKDQGNPSLTGSATVIINIIDINDERPKFSMSHYSFQFRDGQSAGTLVGKVYATDADSPPFNQFAFSIMADPIISSIFTIDANGGDIRTTKVLYGDNISEYHFTVTASELESPWFKSWANVSVYIIAGAGREIRDGDLDVSSDNLLVILALSGALILIVFILLTILILVRRCKRSNYDRHGYISGNFVPVPHRKGDFVRKGDKMPTSSLEAIFDIIPSLNIHGVENTGGNLTVRSYSSKFQSSLNRTDLKDKLPLKDNIRSDLHGSRSTLRSVHSDRRRASQGSKSGSGYESRRKAADGASESSVSSRRDRKVQAMECRIREIPDVNIEAAMKDSDSACSADVSNSDSGNCASDGADVRRRRENRHVHGGKRGAQEVSIKNRMIARRAHPRRLKADSLSSPDMEVSRHVVDINACELREESQPGSSGANRIALVHPQRNGDKQSDLELAEQISQNGSHLGMPGSGGEEQEGSHGPVLARDYGEDSDTASSCLGQESSRLRPEGQSQGRPPKTTPGADRTPPNHGSCVNDTDFYESDSESRGCNILV